MKTVNVRELHEKTGTLVKLAASGHVIRIVRRGQLVAELRPISPSERRRSLPERDELLATFPELEGESGQFLEADRR
jgi:antitoxin (DNA-binding transcriptional repressor) of toxin-antitoxin stability system